MTLKGVTSEPPATEPTPRGSLLTKLLAHPLTLLLVTAVVSGLLVPRLTQQWQDHQQEVAIRRDFAARVSRTVAEIFIATQLAQGGAKSQTQAAFDAAYVKWEVESAVLGAELRAYYRAESLHRNWARCTQLTTAYYVQVGIPDATQRKTYLDGVRTELSLAPGVNLADTAVLRAQVLAARDQVTRQVLDGEMA